MFEGFAERRIDVGEAEIYLRTGDVWRRWAHDVREVALDCGHFVAEEAPEACAAALVEFFGSQDGGL